MKKIAIGADDAAYSFRDAIVSYLTEKGVSVVDYSSDKNQKRNITQTWHMKSPWR
ncbi:MAG: hypothetical protein XXXJIFNMEKO3_00297 [Candidatus Erwinia impunctatus]|nr:hypothetical protein XXXJIFNMEKO_00297 [Culicoides impunctatus]